MYKIPYFTEDNRHEVLSFMREHLFATLIGTFNDRPVATQIPLLFYEREETIFLRGHIMRKTDHHLALEQNPECLVLFQGAHCYVSSGWYTEKQGSTWNYQTVHARGTMKWLDASGTIQLLKELTEKYEHGREKPLLMEDLPEGYVDTHVKGIAGFEIEVTDIYPIFKLSQNRDDTSYINIVEQLRNSEDYQARAVAYEMRKRRPQLFLSAE